MSTNRHKLALLRTIKQMDALKGKAYQHYVRAIQVLVDEHHVELATGRMSDVWRVKPHGADYWLSEFDSGSPHPIFPALQELDTTAAEFGIRPCNMELFVPKKSK